MHDEAMLSFVAALCVAAPATLKWEPRVDLPVTALLVSGWVASEFIAKPALAPRACRWCAVNGFDLEVRRAFNPTLTPSTSGFRGPATASDIVGFVVLPLAMVGIGGLGAWRSDQFWLTWATDVVVMLEATFAALALNQTAKFLTGRSRPYTVDATESELGRANDPNDHFLSFFSGHTTFTFGLAVSAGVIAQLRGYKLAWLTWAVGLPLAIATATLRMAADKHWMTDILVGSAVASACAVALPLLFHGREEAPAMVRVVPTWNGVSVTGSFR
jgi:membrane-associated phospholipid phosphatase